MAYAPKPLKAVDLNLYAPNKAIYIQVVKSRYEVAQEQIQLEKQRQVELSKQKQAQLQKQQRAVIPRDIQRDDISYLLEQKSQQQGLNPVFVLKLLGKESGLNPNAINKTSGACGIFQRHPCPWSKSGGVVGASVDEQINNGLAYIKARYKTSENAWYHFLAKNWY